MFSPSASSEDFSVLSSSHSHPDHISIYVRSRSSTHSYDVFVEEGAESVSAISFSDIGSPRTSMGSSQVLSITTSSVGDVDDGDDFILVPQSSTQLRPAPSIDDFIEQHVPAPTPSLGGHVSEDDDEDEKILVQRSPSVPSSPAGLNRMGGEREKPYSSAAAPELEVIAEEAVRANQRRLQEGAVDDGADGGEGSDEESILFTGEMMQGLSIADGTPVAHTSALPGTETLTSLTTIHAISNFRGQNRFTSATSVLANNLSEVLRENSPTPTLRQAASITPLVSNTNPRALPDLDLNSFIQTTPTQQTDKAVAPSVSAPVQPICAQVLTPTQDRAARRKRAKLRAETLVKAQKPQSQLKQEGNHSDHTSSSSLVSASPTIPNVIDGEVMYEEAVRYVTAYLANPPANVSPETHLQFLQALIIELGLLSKSDVELPNSIRAAKALLKSQIHINVREYVECRARLAKIGDVAADDVKRDAMWLDEIQKLMFPSKAALTRSLYKRRTIQEARHVKPVTTKWIKSRGLDVFLVSFYK
ncbi:hypothetical protein FRB96_002383 [Tulasnella sp. 330]|nr:hypothetical protein FRB96_002383 [Tulasnella sp. 330]KAG8877699.1 hypothetical protein FRB98_006574 [Tulasnella sp. 332]